MDAAQRSNPIWSDMYLEDRQLANDEKADGKQEGSREEGSRSLPEAASLGLPEFEQV
jgi:hypothetical protein